MKDFIKVCKGQLAIKSFQEYLDKLYGGPNSKRQWDYLYGYLSRGIAYLCKNIERGVVQPLWREPSGVVIEPAHFLRPLSWLFAVASRFNVDVQEACLRRFPGICPYCLDRPCLCVRTRKLPVKWLAGWKAEEELNAKYDVMIRHNPLISLQFATDNLFDIYPNNEVLWYQVGPWHHFVKLHEEIGELHEAICQYEVKKKPLKAVGAEVADVLAWLLGAWKIVYAERSIDDTAIDYYREGCPVCSSFPCICTDRQDRIAELVNAETLKAIQSHVANLSEILPQSAVALKDLMKSIEIATRTQSEPTAVKAVKQTASRLEEIRKGLSSVDEIGQKAGGIISTVLSIIDKLPYIS